MWITLIPAMIGLVGVLVGGVITTGANYWLEVKKEEAEAAKDKVSRANELKTTARLVWEEFSEARSKAVAILEKKQWKHEELRLDAWERNRGVLARELPFDVWLKIITAGLVVERFKEWTYDSGSITDGEAVERVKKIVKQIEDGLFALQAYM